MKLLFDENLSPKLAAIVAERYPDSAHIRELNLRGAADRVIWEHARERGYVIVSKDTDFRERSYIEGFPPKIIWLDVGNAGTSAIAELLQREAQRIRHFEQQEEHSLLILSLGKSVAI